MNFLFFVKRIACRLSLRDRDRGRATLPPLRFPDSELKKLWYAEFRSANAREERPPTPCRATPVPALLSPR